MHRAAQRLLVLSLVCAALGACSREDPNAPPLATPTVSFPASVQQGRIIDVAYRFAIAANAPSFDEDYTVFVHGYDVSGTRVWSDDHLPPTPTRQWKPGTTIDYTRASVMPKNVPVGQIRLEMGLYSTSSRDRLPLTGDNDGQRAYRVGSLQVRPAAVPPDQFFVDGFHGIEAPEEAQGLEWRWSKQTGTIGVRNPKRDAVLVIALDQPVALPSPQQVELRTASGVLDTFAVPPRRPMMVKKIPVSAAQLGDQAIARVTLTTNPAFVPARTRALGSSDTRELGVRVFSAYLEPQAAPGAP